MAAPNPPSTEDKVADLKAKLVPLALTGGTVRVSFLMETLPLRDTIEILESNGCTPEATRAFRRAVEHYSSAAFDFDFTKFPKPRGGFYSFKSTSELVAALPHQLCDTQHAYDFNCFDTVVALAGEALRTGLRPDDIAGPFLVPHTRTNGSYTILPRATARDAFTLAYPSWYRNATDTAIPKPMRDARMSLTAILFRCHMLPQSTAEGRLSRGVMETLRSSWRHHEVNFPSRFHIVLCHEISFPQRLFVTSHAGLMFPRKDGYTYIEKSGGRGPFLRLDFKDRVDLLTWLAAMFRGAEALGYTHHFATFNDSKIEVLESRGN